MSWNFNAIGTPENLAAEIDAEAKRLSGQSKEEFLLVALPLKVLLLANIRKNFPRIVHLDACGHASKSGEEVTDSTCNVSLTVLSAKLV